MRVMCKDEEKGCTLTAMMQDTLIELYSRDVIPVDVTITPVHAFKNCIDKPIGES